MTIRPKLRLVLGQELFAEKSGCVVQGYVIYREWDPEDNKSYFWEEWEVGGPGSGDRDCWVEYDHYNEKTTLYEPIELDEKLEPWNLRPHQRVVLSIAGTSYTGIVKEVSTNAVVARREGQLSCNIVEGDRMHYADIQVVVRDGGWSAEHISIERYNDVEYAAYHGMVLSTSDQKRLFQKRIEPTWTRLRMLIVGIFCAALGFIGMIFMLIMNAPPSSNTYCTPRSVSAAPSNHRDVVISQDDNQTCYRRVVYGGGSRGVGK